MNRFDKVDNPNIYQTHYSPIFKRTRTWIEIAWFSPEPHRKSKLYTMKYSINTTEVRRFEIDCTFTMKY